MPRLLVITISKVNNIGFKIIQHVHEDRDKSQKKKKKEKKQERYCMWEPIFQRWRCWSLEEQNLLPSDGKGWTKFPCLLTRTYAVWRYERKLIWLIKYEVLVVLLLWFWWVSLSTSNNFIGLPLCRMLGKCICCLIC